MKGYAVKSAEDISTETQKYLTFILDNQYFAIPIKNVMEIISMQDPTEMPDFPPYVKGIINLRGKIIPLIDLRTRFHRSECEYNERTSVIVVKVREFDVGFIVDEVDEVIDLSKSQIAPPPNMSSEIQNRYIIGVGKYADKIILILDSNKVLSEDEIDDISSGL